MTQASGKKRTPNSLTKLLGAPLPRTPSLSFRIGKFLYDNCDLPDRYDGFRIRPRIDFNGLVLISIILPPKKLEPLRKRPWRKLLSEWQIRAERFNDKYIDITSGWPSPLKQWAGNQSMPADCRPSILDLANDLNRCIMSNLETAFEGVSDDNPQWAEIGKEALHSAREVMTFFNLSDENQSLCVEDGQRRFRNGTQIFKTITHGSRGKKLKKPRLDGPITKDAVREKVRHLRNHFPVEFSATR